MRSNHLKHIKHSWVKYPNNKKTVYYELEDGTILDGYKSLMKELRRREMVSPPEKRNVKRNIVH